MKTEKSAVRHHNPYGTKGLQKASVSDDNCEDTTKVAATDTLLTLAGKITSVPDVRYVPTLLSSFTSTISSNHRLTPHGRYNTIQILRMRGESERVRKLLKVTQLRSDRAPSEPRQSAWETQFLSTIFTFSPKFWPKITVPPIQKLSL